MNNTPIEWTDYSVNPLKMRMPDGTLINVCIHKSDGCRFCYAEGIVKRWWKKDWGEFPGYTAALLKLGTPVLVKAELEAVIRLSNRIAEGKADPKENKIFWNDMTDEYLEFWPDKFLDQIWAVRALTQNLFHQVLTKRPDRLLAYFTGPNRDWDCLREAIEFNHLFYSKNSEMMPQITAAGWLWETYVDNEGFKDGQLEYHGTLPLPNVIVMTSVEDQPTADERIPTLLKVPAAWRGISAEPLLGPTNLTRWLGCADPDHRHSGSCSLYGADRRCNWIICGGESGPKARPMHPAWARSLRDQCVAADVPFFFKQWGNWGPDDNGLIALDKIVLFNHRDNGDKPIYIRDLESDRKENWAEYQTRDDVFMYAVGKKAAGRLLDGCEWNEYPEVAA